MPTLDPSTLPSVTILIVNYNGTPHLPTCLDSLARVDYPRDRVEVLVVDNGSTDGSAALVRARYPWARVLELGENRGFAAGNNAGAAATTTDCLALVNTDMAVEPSWLRELVSAFDPSSGYVCTAGVILDWQGTRLDFAEGAVSYYGMGAQLGFQRPVEDVDIPDGIDLLFACGGSMLIDRRVFLELGGFDAEYFAYFEDVDFGWRLWLSGYKVRLAGSSIVRHRHHGTSGGLPAHRLQMLYERNALRTLVKNLDDVNLWPLLTAALLLGSDRARSFMESRREDYDLFAGADEATEHVSRRGVAFVHAVAELAYELDRLLEQRDEVQARRRRSDAEIFELFRRPFLPVGGPLLPFVEAMATVTHALRLDALFERRRATRVLIIGGPTLQRLAPALARTVAVTVATTVPLEHLGEGVEVAEFTSDEELGRLVVEADVLVADGPALHAHPQLATAPAIRVVDARGDAARGHADVILDEQAPLETIRRVCEAPWRARERRPETLTEDVQMLLSLARAELRNRPSPPQLEPSRPLTVRAARRVWWHTPEPVRRPLRPALRRLQLHRQRRGTA